MKENQLRHSVIFNLKYQLDSPDAEKFLKESKVILEKIIGVENFEVLRQVSPKNDFQYGFSMEFADLKAFEAYTACHEHTKYVNDYWIPNVIRFLEIDYKKYNI